MTIEMTIKGHDVYGGSQEVINKLLEELRLKENNLIPYHKQALQLLDKLQTIEAEHVPWITNKMANALANVAAILVLGV